MAYLLAAILLVLNTGWLLLVVFGLPGNWLMVLSSAGVVWWQWGNAAEGGVEMFDVWTLGVIVALALVAELAEFLTGVFGSKKAGGTRWGSLGAMFGGIAGAVAGTPFIPIVGTLIGACIGAALGAWGLELASGRKWGESAKSGVGAGVGTLVGRVIKVAGGVLIWLIVAVAAFWP